MQALETQPSRDGYDAEVFLLDRCYIHVRLAYGCCSVDNLLNNPHINPEMALIETLDISVTFKTFLFYSYHPFFFFHSFE